MASTADSQVEFRRRQHAKDPQQHNAGVGAEHASFVSSGARPASTFVAPMMTQPTSFHEKNNANEQNDAISFERLSRSSHRGRHPTSYGAGAGGEEVPNEATAVFLLRGRPGSTGGTTVLPALRDSSRAARGTNQVSIATNSFRFDFFCASSIVVIHIRDAFGFETEID